MDTIQLAAILPTLDLSETNGIMCFQLEELAGAHAIPFRPDVPALLLGPASTRALAQATELLLGAYPADYSVQIRSAGRHGEVKLEALRDLGGIDESVCIFLPAAAAGRSFEAFSETVARLRAPDGCPWDRQQTHKSLRIHLLEEAYETLSAIDASDPSALREELGDLLLQIVLHAQIASEGRAFSSLDVIQEINEKIVRRHPHVFGGARISGVQGVLENWERLKEHERRSKSHEGGLLDGVPLALPALSQSQEYQDRAARVGFDWPIMEGVLDKIQEEVQEIRDASDEQDAASELGDLLFVLVNFARWKGLDAESVLRAANSKFKRRFAAVEAHARATNKRLSEMSFEEMDAIWSEIKGAEE